ncbi:MAG: AAA family ATPase [Chloroflexota bacterium]
MTHGGIQHDDPYTNHKGGVGKSTSATNIALGIVAVLRQADAKKYRVLLIDTDSQAHATLVTTGRNNYGTEDSLYAVLMADRQVAPQVLSDCIIPSTWDDNLHVLSGSPLLEQAERELQGTAGAPDDTIPILFRPDFSLVSGI